ncbi:MAG: DUF5666 domain-containing protein [Thermomicrobiales bacterium]
MRRNSIWIVIGVVLLLGIIGTGFVAYGKGKTAGELSVSSDRSAFARGTTVSGGQGAGGAGTGGQRTGGAGGTGNTGAGGTGGTGGTTAGTGSSVTGKVTKADNGTLTLQEQPNNVAVTVATDASTTVTTFAPGALGDLKSGDIVAVQGDKTGDTAYAAKTIFALNAVGGGRGAGQAPGGASDPSATTATGSPAGGGRGRPSGNASGGAASAPAARAGGGGGVLAGLNGPTGRIMTIANGTLTLQGFDGATTTVTTNASTTIRTQTAGNVSDIKAGDTIIVQGDKASDQAYTARTIIDQGAGA